MDSLLFRRRERNFPLLFLPAEPEILLSCSSQLLRCLWTAGPQVYIYYLRLCSQISFVVFKAELLIFSGIEIFSCASVFQNNTIVSYLSPFHPGWFQESSHIRCAGMCWTPNLPCKPHICFLVTQEMNWRRISIRSRFKIKCTTASECVNKISGDCFPFFALNAHSSALTCWGLWFVLVFPSLTVDVTRANWKKPDLHL